MKSKIDERLLEVVSLEKIRDVDRYYLSIQYVLGLKYFFNKHQDVNTRFVGAEVILKRNNNKPLNPDACLQVKNDDAKLIGFPIEIKSSLSDDNNIFEELQKMERYNEKLSGWETKSGYVDDEVIIFSPYHEDAGKSLRILKNSIKENKLSFKKEFLLWQWSFIPSLKNPNEELLFVQQIHGELSNKKIPGFDKCVSDGIRQDINEVPLLIEKERNSFINQRPPVEYTMLTLWQNVFSKYLNESNNLISADKVVEVINTYYADSLMKNPNNKVYRFKKDWAESALNMFVNIGMAKKIGVDYQIVLSCNRKNIKEYLCKKVAIFEIKKGLHTDKSDKISIKDLSEFKHTTKGLFENEN